MKRTLTLAAVLVLIALVAAACGRRHHKHHGELTDAQLERRAHDKLDYALDEIDATDAQRARFAAILDKSVLPEVKKLRPLKKETRDILLSELLSGKPDAARLHSLVDQRSVTLTGFAHTMADAAVEAHGELTPKQRAEIAERMDDHADRHDDEDREWMAKMFVDRALDKLDASDKQEELVYDHKDRLMTEMKTLKKGKDRNRATMTAMVRSADPDAAVLHKLIDARSGAYTRFAHQVVDSAVEIAATLTPKQRQLIREKIEERK